MKTLARNLAMGLLLLSAVAGAGTASAADKLTGKWKLVVLAFAEDEFVVLKVEPKDGQLAAEVVDSQAFLRQPSIKKTEQQGDAVTLVLDAAGSENTFSGRRATEGAESGRFLGTLAFRGSTFPARLEKTDEDKVTPIGPRQIAKVMADAKQEPDAKSQVAALIRALKEVTGPNQHQLYAAILRSAQDAALSADEVRQHLQTWFAAAAPYGPNWLAECRSSALKALQGQKPYAEMTLALAQEADKALGADATTEQRSAALQSLLAAARATGKLEIAQEASARLEKIEAKLDEEYHHAVPPFKPEAFAGRSKPDSDRVVLMELFTGAQCPPCVAADVAFDALLKTYASKDVVTLQYHLHIPGPDPLTNPDSVARMSYYQGRGTPSTYFNGKAEAYGGGLMAGAQAKYDDYRKIIEGRLDDKRLAKINLQATRSGDKILVTANVDAKAYLDAKAAEAKQAADVNAKTKKEGDTKENGEKDSPAAEPKLRLRLALTEEAIRYVGGNRLRFHHHVVRGMPGGAEGKPVDVGQAQVSMTIDLGEVREGLSKYLDDFSRNTSFPNVLPDIALKGLSLVAFVQDDADKTVIDAASVSIPDAE